MTAIENPNLDKPLYYDFLREDVGTWTAYNFPGQLPHQPLLGMHEECSELMLAKAGSDTEEVKDAIADFLIYAAGYAFMNRIPMHDAYLHAKPLVFGTQPNLPLPTYGELVHHIWVFSGQLSQVHLKIEQRIRADKHNPARKAMMLGRLLAYMDLLASGLGVVPKFEWADYLASETFVPVKEIVDPVWKKVRARDWQKNPVNGLPL